MSDPATVVWQQTMISGEPWDQWFARLPSRGGAVFASVSLVVSGDRWNCNVFPDGRAPGTREFHFYTSSLEKGKALIERWARHHWQSVKG